VANAAGGIAYYLFPIPRGQILENLAMVLPEVPGPDRARIARHAFQNDAKNWIDTLRIPHMSVKMLMEIVDLEGWDRLETAVAENKGLILVSAHLGNFDFVGQIVVAHGYKMTIPVERMKPERLFRFLVAQRASRGINIVPLERGPRELMRAVRAGDIAGLTADRVVAGRGVRVEFFGRQASMPRGPASLARHTGAPLLVGIAVRGERGRFRGIILPEVEMQRTLDPEADEQENTRRIVATLERFIRQYPDQWTAFSAIWTRDQEQESPATIGQQNEAAV
jgi:lauroyl/myristoyl acyltransferase